MRALLCRAFGPPESLAVEECPDPVPGDEEVLIRVLAAGVNFPDTLIIQDRYQFKPAFPFSPGGECAGVIEAVGPKVKGFAVGDAVLAFCLWGAFAEKIAVDASKLVMLPPNVDIDFVDAASFLIASFTSYHGLVDRAGLKAGETLLVLGAAGGVGLAAIEIGKRLGARVIAAASTAEKLGVCLAHGADHAVNYLDEDLRARVKELTGGRGADVIYDPVGGAFSETAFRCIAWRGRHLVVGFANGEIPRLPLNLTLLKGAAVLGVFVDEYLRRERDRAQQDLRTLIGWLRDGKLRPRVAGTFPLDRAPEAIRQVMDRKVAGRLVVIPTD